MNLRGVMGGLGGMKGKREIMQLYYNLEKHSLF